MLTLSYTKRATLLELLQHTYFKDIRDDGEVLNASHVVPEFMINQVDAPLLGTDINIDKFKYFRGVIVQWMFDFYDLSRKLQLFVHAVNIFDRYLSLKHVPLRKYVKLATTCAYMAQYVYKRQALTLRTVLESSKHLTKTLLHKNNINEPSAVSADVEELSNDILVTLSYDLYRITFDVLLAKQNLSVDMTIVANVLINNTGPYQNDGLLKKYVKMKY
jgi:hypothetical protein